MGLRLLVNDPGVTLMANGAILLMVIVFLPRGVIGLGVRLRQLVGGIRATRKVQV